MTDPTAARLRRVWQALRAAPGTETAPAPEAPRRPGEGRFETRSPSPQTVIDLWQGNWASDLREVLDVEGSGQARLFRGDPRPGQAAEAHGAGGRFDGASILELGPLEAGHSLALQELGAARITGVEASAEAYLKCLAVKELLGIDRLRLLFGDAVGFLEATPDRYDVVFCSGFLYHMADPLRLIEAIARVTDRCFVWTHYHDAADAAAPRVAGPLERNGFATRGWRLDYGAKGARFWGGNQSGACWLELDAMLAAFAHAGLGQATLIDRQAEHPHGPAVTFAVRRA